MVRDSVYWYHCSGTFFLSTFFSYLAFPSEPVCILVSWITVGLSQLIFFFLNPTYLPTESFVFLNHCHPSETSGSCHSLVEPCSVSGSPQLRRGASSLLSRLVPLWRPPPSHTRAFSPHSQGPMWKASDRPWSASFLCLLWPFPLFSLLNC